MEKLLLDELRTIKFMCIANFIEIQEIKRKLDIGGNSRDDMDEYANNTSEHLEALSKKLHRLLKDDLPNLWEGNIGKREG